MTPDPLVVAPGTTLDAVVRTMRRHDTGSVLVVEDGRLLGIVTARDVLRAVAGDVRPRGVRTAVDDRRTGDGQGGHHAGRRRGVDDRVRVHPCRWWTAKRPVGMVGLRDVSRSQREAKRLAIGLGF